MRMREGDEVVSLALVEKSDEIDDEDEDEVVIDATT